MILSHIDPEGVKRRSRNKLKRREYKKKGNSIFLIEVLSGPGYADTFSSENAVISLPFHLLLTRKR